MIRKLAAAVVGVVVALLKFGEPEQIREFISTLPAGSILFVGAAWALGTFLGTLAGALVSGSRALPYATVVGGIVLAGAITMLLIIPHPWWFTIAAPVSIIIAAVLAVYLARRLHPSSSTPE
jgi:hypothetical protein